MGPPLFQHFKICFKSVSNFQYKLQEQLQYMKPHTFAKADVEKVFYITH